MKISIPYTNIKIVVTTEAKLNDLVSWLAETKRKEYSDEGWLAGYQEGRSDLAAMVKEHFADIDLGPGVWRVPVLDLPAYQDQPKGRNPNLPSFDDVRGILKESEEEK